MSRQRGGGAVDYLAIIGVVSTLFVGLTTLVPHRPDRRPPVNPIPAIVRLLGTPLANLEPRPVTPRPPGRPRPPRRPPRRPKPPVTIPLPEWWVR